MLLGIGLVPNNCPADIYSINPSESQISFKATRLGIPFVSGHFNSYRGTLNIEEGKFNEFKGTLDIASLETGILARDNFLKSGNFFDTQNYPILTIESRQISQAENKILIDALLTVKGITKPMKLSGTLKNSGLPRNEAKLVLRGVIRRHEYGLKLNKILELFVNDDVKIFLRLNAQK